jgi:ribosomal protein S18 acetylase RimI-like enzyme
MKRIHQIAVHKNFRNIGVGSRLLNFISAMEDGDLTIINVDLRIKNGKDFLEKRILVNYTNQYEMEFEF